MMENREEIFICECNSTEHQIIFLKEMDENYPICFVSIHLCKKPFWKRVKYAMRYIFGYKCAYGAFDEIILNRNDAYKLDRISAHLKYTDKTCSVCGMLAHPVFGARCVSENCPTKNK